MSAPRLFDATTPLARPHALHRVTKTGYQKVQAAPWGRLARFYRGLAAVVKKRDWEAAAVLSNRRQVSHERNEEIAGLLLGQAVDA